eukprot:scaffold222729_cov21-Prasinocladus_malaysianus.AAC.1
MGDRRAVPLLHSYCTTKQTHEQSQKQINDTITKWNGQIHIVSHKNSLDIQTRRAQRTLVCVLRSKTPHVSIVLAALDGDYNGANRDGVALQILVGYCFGSRKAKRTKSRHNSVFNERWKVR